MARRTGRGVVRRTPGQRNGRPEQSSPSARERKKKTTTDAKVGGGLWDETMFCCPPDVRRSFHLRTGVCFQVDPHPHPHGDSIFTLISPRCKHASVL
ncbi:GM19367 [Drosophila sechellia]|uniref:GM19367 n=1 Tax=Drosophila sechellia TaxID=7238 RepID=B4HU87_DROSE|nr:GM19367 [Drosophila sechellia]